jgi:hypothetical protein
VLLTLLTEYPVTMAATRKSKKRVTFSPFVEVVDIPRTDPGVKDLIWFSKYELFLISLDFKRRILLYQAIKSLEKKRAIAENLPEICATHPVKRLRITTCLPIDVVNPILPVGAI